MKDLTQLPHVAERLYYDSHELEFRARVTDIQLVAQEKREDGERAQLWRVALDRTAFYPESGGQPWDAGVLIATARSGAVLEVPVERVEEDDAGEVWHFVRKPLVEGTEVEGRVDAGRRMDHMQQHSGQHLLSAVVLERLGGRTTGFHLGADTSTIDLILPDGSDVLAPEGLVHIEAEVNRCIFEDRFVKSCWFTRAEAEAMLAEGTLRKLPNRTGPMRVVEMQGVEFNACGGTHVRSTGAIGGLFLRRVERARQGWRVEFLCGLRAVKAARDTYQVLGGVANLLSVGYTDVLTRVTGLQEEARAGAKIRRGLLEELAEAEAKSLLAQSKAGQVIQASFPEKPIEFAKRLASRLAASSFPAAIAVQESGKGAFVLALPQGDSRHAGNLVRDLGSTMGARGGGGRDLAQGTCDPGQLETVLKTLVDHLQ